VYRPAEEWRKSSEYLTGVALYNAGHPWDAHEVWEDLWLAARAARDDRQREFLQGLIQCAAACVKAGEGKRDSCRKLAARALGRLEMIAGVYMGLDVPAFVAAFAAWAATAMDAPPPIRLATM
jgi:predicted metal-dependent hydrolase